MEQFSAIDFPQRVTKSELLQHQYDRSAILMMMQKVRELYTQKVGLLDMHDQGLAEHDVVSEEGRNRMAKNLYNLLRSYNLLSPECQLHSGMVGWSGELPIEGGRNDDIYKGRYLQSEDVRIKVMRTVNMKDEKTVQVRCRGRILPTSDSKYLQRIRREVEVWGKIYAVDKGKHISPFYGFYSPDGFRL